MTLRVGYRLGSYDIVGMLGAGAMGEVYRAHDAKLGRDVAIKVLADRLAADPERLARFEREARALAALNHPHIAHVYSFEQLERRAVLVMELVPGEDLAERIVRGAIPLDAAIPIAIQLVVALAAAHAEGIVHRDLKPANIKVRADGVVKVLDFGLAKAVSASGGFDAHGRGNPTEPSESPTMTALAPTLGGVIMGTPAYMAPEQAKGQPVDKRADIWAFGCVLYEMLAGRRAFDGADTTELLAAVVRDNPDWDALPRETPAAIRRLLLRCLAKDRTRRLADISDARLDLDEAQTEPLERSKQPTAATPPERPRPSFASRLAWLGAGVVLLAAALLVIQALTPSSPLPVPQLQRMTNAVGNEESPALVAGWQIRRICRRQGWQAADLRASAHGWRLFPADERRSRSPVAAVDTGLGGRRLLHAGENRRGGRNDLGDPRARRATPAPDGGGQRRRRQSRRPRHRGVPVRRQWHGFGDGRS